MRELKDLYFRQSIAKSLSHSIEIDKIASSYLFSGQQGSAKLYTALALAYTIKKLSGDPYAEQGFQNLAHPDINIIVPVKKEISDDPVKYREVVEKISQNPMISPTLEGQPNIPVDSIRKLINWLRTAPTYSGGRFAIVFEAQRMRQEAANAFLKTLEEPSPDSHIILISTEPEALLPTIRSRTQAIAFPVIKDTDLLKICIEDFGLTEDSAQNIVKASAGSLKKAKELKEGDLTEINFAEETLWKAVLSKNLGLALQWSTDKPQDRQFAENLLLQAQQTLRNSMVYYCGQEIIATETEKKIASDIKGLSTFKKALDLFEKLIYENKRNPQWKLFWINIPLQLQEIL